MKASCSAGFRAASPDAWSGVGHAAAEDWAAAEAAFREALKRNPTPVRRGNLGRTLAFQGRWEEAESELRAHVDGEPDSMDARRALAHCLNQLGEQSAALEQARAAVELDPSDACASGVLGDILLAGGDRVGAREQYDAALRAEAEYSYVRARLGQIMLGEGEEEGLAHLARAAELDPESWWVRSAYAAALADGRDNWAALGHARAAVELAPRQPRPRITLALTLAQARRPSDGLREAEVAVYLSSGDRHLRGEAHVRASQICNMLGDSGKAIEHARNATEVNPDEPAYRIILAGALYWDGQYEAALEEYGEAARLDPGMSDVPAGAGCVLLRMERPEQALEQLRRAKELDPTDYLSRVYIGTTLRDLGRMPEAVDELKAVISDSPEYGRAYYALAECYTEMGLPEKAQEQYSLAWEHGYWPE